MWNDRHLKTSFINPCNCQADPIMQGESNSISNQKRILETYAKQNGYSNLRWYKDDGYSGENFQRPGFQAMLADIEAGKVGTVIVKDMSRFCLLYTSRCV